MSIHLVHHSLAQCLLTQLRDERTPPNVFRNALRKLSTILAVEATRFVATTKSPVKTPLEITDGFTSANQTVLIPVMRAGAGMLDAFLSFLPHSLVWHMSVSRDEKTFEPCFHGSTIPQNAPPDADYFVLDPMLATGGSACLTIDKLKSAGARHIVFVGILGAPEGAEKLQSTHPDVHVILGGLDRELNDRAYILPGLGDAGDRLFPKC